MMSNIAWTFGRGLRKVVLYVLFLRWVENDSRTRCNDLRYSPLPFTTTDEEVEILRKLEEEDLSTKEII